MQTNQKTQEKSNEMMLDEKSKPVAIGAVASVSTAAASATATAATAVQAMPAFSLTPQIKTFEECQAAFFEAKPDYLKVAEDFEKLELIDFRAKFCRFAALLATDLPEKRMQVLGEINVFLIVFDASLQPGIKKDLHRIAYQLELDLQFFDLAEKRKNQRAVDDADISTFNFFPNAIIPAKQLMRIHISLFFKGHAAMRLKWLGMEEADLKKEIDAGMSNFLEGKYALAAQQFHSLMRGGLDDSYIYLAYWTAKLYENKENRAAVLSEMRARLLQTSNLNNLVEMKALHCICYKLEMELGEHKLAEERVKVILGFYPDFCFSYVHTKKASAHIAARIMLGFLCVEFKYFTHAIDLLKTLDVGEAQFYLSTAYQVDSSKTAVLAVECLSRAVIKDYSPALVYRTIGRIRHFTDAKLIKSEMKQLEQLAGDNPIAACDTALLYFEGRKDASTNEIYIKKNYEKAKRYLERAAKHSHSDAQYLLADYSISGKYGCKIDFFKAVNLLQQAAAVGFHKNAAYLYSVLILKFYAEKYKEPFEHVHQMVDAIFKDEKAKGNLRLETVSQALHYLNQIEEPAFPHVRSLRVLAEKLNGYYNANKEAQKNIQPNPEAAPLIAAPLVIVDQKQSNNPKKKKKLKSKPEPVLTLPNPNRKVPSEIKTSLVVSSDSDGEFKVKVKPAPKYGFVDYEVGTWPIPEKSQDEKARDYRFRKSDADASEAICRANESIRAAEAVLEKTAVFLSANTKVVRKMKKQLQKIKQRHLEHEAEIKNQEALVAEYQAQTAAAIAAKDTAQQDVSISVMKDVAEEFLKKSEEAKQAHEEALKRQAKIEQEEKEIEAREAAALQAQAALTITVNLAAAPVVVQPQPVPNVNDRDEDDEYLRAKIAGAKERKRQDALLRVPKPKPTESTKHSLFVSNQNNAVAAVVPDTKSAPVFFHTPAQAHFAFFQYPMRYENFQSAMDEIKRKPHIVLCPKIGGYIDPEYQKEELARSAAQNNNQNSSATAPQPWTLAGKRR